MNKVAIETPFIRLDQFMKLAAMTGSGGESKMLIAEGEVKVNGAVETRRGKKLVAGDVVEFDTERYQVTDGS